MKFLLLKLEFYKVKENELDSFVHTQYINLARGLWLILCIYKGIFYHLKVRQETEGNKACIFHEPS